MGQFQGRVSDGGARGARAVRRAAARGRSGGYTLIELVLALALTSLLVGSMVSAIVVVTKAGSDSQGDGGWRRAAAGLERMGLDVTYATSVPLRGVRAIEVSVADRTGDGTPETIRYEWSGVKGEGLIRTFNGTGATVVPDVEEFALEYLVRTETEASAGADVVSGERLLASGAASLLGLGDRAFRVEQGRYIAQVISPALPLEATSWSITRAKVVARSDELVLGSGSAYVQVRSMNGSQPGDRVLAQDTISEGGLGLVFGTHSVNFGEVTGFAPSDSAALVVAFASGDLEVSYTRSGSGRFETQDGGATWQSNSGETMIFEAYGRYSTPGAATTTSRHFLTGVRVRVRTMEQDAAAAVTTVALLEPQELTDEEMAALESAGVADEVTIGPG